MRQFDFLECELKSFTNFLEKSGEFGYRVIDNHTLEITFDFSKFEPKTYWEQKIRIKSFFRVNNCFSFQFTLLTKEKISFCIECRKGEQDFVYASQICTLDNNTIQSYSMFGINPYTSCIAINAKEINNLGKKGTILITSI